MCRSMSHHIPKLARNPRFAQSGAMDIKNTRSRVPQPPESWRILLMGWLRNFPWVGCHHNAFMCRGMPPNPQISSKLPICTVLRHHKHPITGVAAPWKQGNFSRGVLGQISTEAVATRAWEWAATWKYPIKSKKPWQKKQKQKIMSIHDVPHWCALSCPRFVIFFS